MNKQNWVDSIEKNNEYHDKNVKKLADFLKELDETGHPLEDFKNFKGKKRNKRKYTRKS